ncbi:TIGR02186 family protein [Thalassovita taeanensis]|uniref:Transmembrane protein (Alph_Pro_TM) n=1 Tax=Thalassovita taeanensis TaxID=657014 RepID=A0A1H9D8S0_9RHOB|nr:TIGR02186 family protein [Thalassovita taeanensis]SEQ09876.1 conserved hypothetical protein [Thalassovita taeanensis]
MIRAALLLLFLLLPLRGVSAETEQVVLGLSHSRVAITARFDGSDILVFGAVKRETPIPDDRLDVIIAIVGPSHPTTVRRKSRLFGIWINTAAVEVDSAPAFYAVATSGPLGTVLSDTEDLRHRISIRRAIRSVGAPSELGDAQDFTRALIRIKQNDGSYQLLEGAVEVDQQTLFRTSIALPSNLTEGNYATRIFLTRNGAVVSHFETVIDVRKVGLERFLFNLAREQALAYGLLSLAIAIAAGWLASTAFRLLRNS